MPVVSVAFKRDDFEKVAKYAERSHMSLSAFLRYAALGKHLQPQVMMGVTGEARDPDR